MRYIFGFILFLLLIVVGLIFIFRGNNKKPVVTPNAPVVLALPDYATTDATVSMVVDGRVNGEDAHRAIRVTVGRDSRNLEIIQGYSGRVIDTHSFPNTTDAYDVFLRSLNNSGFMTKQKNTKAPADPRGLCPDGFRTILTLNKGGEPLSRLWTSTCGIGNFGGNIDLVNDLFRMQITGYDDLTSQVEL